MRGVAGEIPIHQSLNTVSIFRTKGKLNDFLIGKGFKVVGVNVPLACCFLGLVKNFL